ncbi:MAG: flagellar hook-basal body complex protein FliE [Cypionkella sp.]|jgi:flagellar hook-basal body complex protein FliE|nr:flagellar hook-basal body complex protein FliE [Cypionkella sp.]
MDIKKALAAQAYAQTRSAAGAEPPPNSAEEGAARFLGTFSETLSRGEATARAAMTGNADPHALVEALASSQSAVETVVTVRDRVVEAYQEILRMPV